MPGTRVVSHDFAMNGWKPDDSAVVETNGMSHDVYFWVMPANVSGSWAWTWPEEGKLDPCRLDLEQHFQTVTGRLNVAGADFALIDASISGDRIKFSVDRVEHGKTLRVVFAGRAVRDTIDGVMAVRDSGRAAEKPWRAERNPATRKAIDVDDASRF
jgi:hypothetical protein